MRGGTGRRGSKIFGNVGLMLILIFLCISMTRYKKKHTWKVYTYIHTYIYTHEEMNKNEERDFTTPTEQLKYIFSKNTENETVNRCLYA